MTAQPSDESWSQLRLSYRLGAATADAYHEAGFSVVVQDVVIGRDRGILKRRPQAASDGINQP